MDIKALPKVSDNIGAECMQNLNVNFTPTLLCSTFPTLGLLFFFRFIDATCSFTMHSFRLGTLVPIHICKL